MEIPDGKYRGRARSAPATLIESGKGTPGLSVEIDFTTQDGAQTSLTWTGWLSDGPFDRTIESLRYMGWEGDNLENVTGLDKNEVELVIENEEYEGNVYPRIQFINRIGGALGAKMTADKAKTFAAAMRNRIRALDASKGGSTKPSAPAARTTQRQPPPRNVRQPEPPPHGDDDIPF